MLHKFGKKKTIFNFIMHSINLYNLFIAFTFMLLIIQNYIFYTDKQIEMTVDNDRVTY